MTAVDEARKLSKNSPGDELPQPEFALRAYEVQQELQNLVVNGHDVFAAVKPLRVAFHGTYP